MLGFGTNAARRAMKSGGSKITSVVPSRYGILSWQRKLPFGVSDRRFSATAERILRRYLLPLILLVNSCPSRAIQEMKPAERTYARRLDFY